MSDIPDFLRGLVRPADRAIYTDHLMLAVELQGIAKYREANPNGKPWQHLGPVERSNWVTAAGQA